MNDRELLHWIVDQLDEGKLDEARIAVGGLLDDPLERALMTAPLDDEPLTEAERRALSEVDRSARTYTNEEVAELLERANRNLVR